MHLIVCVEDRYGMSFCGRRLSRDRVVTDHILHMVSESKLWIHPESAILFPKEKVQADTDFLKNTKIGDYCFVEVTPLPENIENLESVTLYHWNRAYPSTMKFPQNLLTSMHLICKEDFPGNSHDMITMERYTL